MSRDSQRFRKVYSYYRPTPRASDNFSIDTELVLDTIRAIDWKQSVRYASTGNYDISTGGGSLNGQSMNNEDRVLLKDQTNAAQNGIYSFNSTQNTLERTLDATQDALTCGATCYVDEGTNAETFWTLTTVDDITVGTTNQTWEQKIGSGGGGGGGAGPEYFTSTTNGSIFTTGSAIFRGTLGGGYDSPADIGTDVFFFVSGTASTNADQTQQQFLNSPSKAVFGGDVVISGSAKIENDLFFVSGSLQVEPGPAQNRIVVKGQPATLAERAVTVKAFGGDDSVNTDPNIAAGNVILQAGSATAGASPGQIQVQLGTGDGTSVDDGRAVFYVGDRGGHILITGGADEGDPGGPQIGLDTILFISGTIAKEGYDGRRTVFGGDVQISGAVQTDRGIYVSENASFSVLPDGSGEALYSFGSQFKLASYNSTFFDLGLGATNPIFRSNLTGDGNQEGYWQWSSGSGFVPLMTLENNTGKFSLGPHLASTVGADVQFYVSGSVTDTGASDKKAVFNTDIRASGSVEVLRNLHFVSGSILGFEGGTGDNNNDWGRIIIRGNDAISTDKPVAAVEIRGGSVDTSSAGPADVIIQGGNTSWSNVDAANVRLLVGTASLAGSGRDGAIGAITRNSGLFYVSPAFNRIVNTDVNFYVSGSRGGGVGLDTPARKSLFNADVVVSGSLSIYGNISGSHTTLWNGAPAFLAGPYITLRTSSLGAVEITGTAPPSRFYQWNELSPAPALNTTASITLAGELGSSFNATAGIGTDAFFYVSGSINGTGNADKKAVFGGDIAASGSIFTSFIQPGPFSSRDIFIGVSGTQALGPAESGNIYIAAQPGISPFSPGNVVINAGNVDYPGGDTTGSISIHGGDVNISASMGSFNLSADKLTLGVTNDVWMTLKSYAFYFTPPGIAEATAEPSWGFLGSFPIGLNPDLKDFTLLATSSLSDATQRGVTIGLPAGQSQKFAITTFAGDTDLDPANVTLNPAVVTIDESGNVRSAGFVTSSLGLSGSLTRLHDGRSYLVAGSGISIASGSNDQVTISSTAVTSPAGSNTQVQFNDNNAFGASSNLTFNTSNSTLSVSNVVVSGDLTVNGTTTTVNTVNLEVKDAVIGLGFSSGTIAQSAGDRGWIGGISGGNNVLFKWDNSNSEFVVGRTATSSTGSLPISIASYSNLHAANVQAAVVTASLGFSGSLTRLSDGSSYLVAGSNISITSASNGSVTIASTATTAAAGSDTQVQFNDGGTAFGGDSGLTYNKNTDTLSVVNLSITATDDLVWSLKDNSAGALNISAGLGNNRFTFNTGDGQERLGFWDGVRASFGDINDPDLNIQHDGTNSTITNKTGLLILSGANGLDITGSTKFAQGLSGSLTRLTDGSSYIVAGNGISVTTSSNGSITITNDGTVGDITAVTAGTGLTGGGSSGAVTLGINDSVVATVSGSTFTGAVSFNLGLSGSLTHLANGTSYLVAGAGIQITTGSNGSVTITNDGTVGDITSVTAGTGLTGGGSSGAVTLNVNDSVVATVSGSTFTGAVSFNSGLSGSLTRLTSGVSYLAAGSNITIVTGSSGQVTISSTAVGGGGDTFFSSTTAASIFTSGSAAFVGSGDEWSTGTNPVDSPRDKGTDVFFYVSGSTSDKALFGGPVVTSGTISALGGISGSLTKLNDGTSYLVAGQNVTIVTGSNGAVTISSTVTQIYSKGFVLGSAQDGGGDIDFSSIGTLVSGYDVEEDIDVYYNGQLLVGGASNDYTVPNTTTLHLNFTCSPQDVITIRILTASPTGGALGYYPGGADTNVQFNDGGNLGGNAAFTFNKNTGVVTTQDLKPAADVTYNLGAADKRWANVYTGDLHLKNDRGDWTIVEEEDFLCVVNNKTGRRFKMALIPLED